MKKRWLIFAVMGIWLILATVAAAESVRLTLPDGTEWLRFEAAPGVTCTPLEEAGEGALFPELEPLYLWMQKGNPQAEIRLIRMPAGRALASASLTELGMALTAEELAQMWPRMAENLGQTALFVNDEAACAKVDTLNGREWLHVQTTAVLEGEKMLTVLVEGYANCDNGWLVELWTLEPAQATYLYEEEAATELGADAEALRAWLASCQAPVIEAVAEAQAGGAPAQSLPGEAPAASLKEYTDAALGFTLQVPDNAIAVPPGETAARLSAAQQDVQNAQLLPLYRFLLGEAQQFEGTLLMEPNYGTAMLVSVYDMEEDVTLEDLQRFEPAISQSVGMDLASVMRVGAGKIETIGNEEYVVLEYRGLFSGRPATLKIMMSPLGSTVREIDLWTQDAPEKDPWVEAWMEALKTIQYAEATEP